MIGTNDQQSREGAPAIVEMTGVRFRWPGRDAFGIAIDRFELGARERLLLLGPSGSGKSTFLSLLAGIVTPQAGTVRVLGNDMARLSSAGRDRFRAEHFGIIFQMFNLLPYGSVIDNVVLPLSFSGKRRTRAGGDGAARDEAVRLLTRLGIAGSLMDGHRASNLSVGQQQRVAAARALIGRPEIVIADEPTSALDRDRHAAFLDLLFQEVEAAGAALVMVTHDRSLASRFDRVVELADMLAPSTEPAP